MGLEANETRLRASLERSLALATALTPEIGYERAADLAKAAHRSGRTIREVAGEISGISKEKLAQLLDPIKMVGQALLRTGLGRPHPGVVSPSFHIVADKI